MEMLQSLLAVSCVIFFITYSWKILNWAWLKPKKLEACLREQGLRGNTYRLFLGDTVDMRNMADEAKAKPMNFSNEIVAKVMPFITTNINKYGNMSFMWFGPTPSVIITEAKLMRDILSKNYIYQKIPRNPLAKLLFRGLADYETDKWAKHRRLINPTFHQEKLKNMLPAFYLCCQEMLAKWEKLVQTKKLCEIDVFPYLQTMTSDAISRTAFGSNYEEGRKIFELQTEQTMYADHVFRSIYIPGFRFVPTKRNRRMKEIQREVKSLVLELINKRMKFIEAGEAEKHDDLLSVLLESNYKEIQQHESKGVGMSLEEVIEECKLFYFSGQETTAGLLVWTMILLSKHPDWQARAREEVLATFGSKAPTYDELSHMKIATMILNEVLRLYPPVVMIRRLTTSETKLGRTTLPAGVQLIMPVLTLHHDKESWGDDAEEFNPERFREGVSKATKGEVSFFPFGWGPRICIGQSFAMLEAKMALVMILQRFTFELSPSYTHAPHTSMTLQPQHGAHLSLCRL